MTITTKEIIKQKNFKDVTKPKNPPIPCCTPKTRASFKELSNEFRSILSIDLTFKASSILEKLFWISLAVSGTAWAIYFIDLTFVINQNPVIGIQLFNNHFLH